MANKEKIDYLLLDIRELETQSWYAERGSVPGIFFQPDVRPDP